MPGILQSDGRYKFAYSVAAPQMTEVVYNTITAEKNGEEITTDVYSYSVREYGEAVIKSESTSKTMKDLAAQMLNYGAYTQLYFGYNTDDLANKNLTELGYSTALDDSMINLSAEATFDPFDGETKAQFTTNSLIFESDTALKYYITMDEKFDNAYMAYRVKDSGDEYSYIPLTPNGDRYYATIKGIKTPLLTDYYETFVCLAAFPEREQKINDSISAYTADLAYVKTLPRDESGKKPELNITIGGKTCESRKEAAAAINKAYLSITAADTPVKIGIFQGLDMYLTANAQSNYLTIARATITIKGHAEYKIDVDDPSSVGTPQRLENALSEAAIGNRIEMCESNLTRLRSDLAEAQKIVSQPFPQQDELSEKQSRLKTLTEEAAERKKNAPQKQKTCYFSRAEHRKNLQKNIAKAAPKKEKSKDKNRDSQGFE